jgi:hypothetical protein
MTPATRTRTLRAVALAVVLATGVAAYVRCATRGEAGELPAYASSAATLRAHAASEPFEVVLRPASAAPKIVVYAFGIGDREPNPLDVSTSFASDGTVRITGMTKALAGAREARFVIATPASVRRFDDALERAKSGADDGAARVVSVPIVRD